MSGLIERLERLSEADTKVRAVLRRSLSFDPGTFVQAFPYVEPFLGKNPSPWQREVFYLVAGLWAAHWREGSSGTPQTIATACAAHQRKSGSASVERRFITLLDADTDQLHHRLRHVVTLLKGYCIDFDSLLSDLLYWNDDRKRTQNSWARQFYQQFDAERTGESKLNKENGE